MNMHVPLTHGERQHLATIIDRAAEIRSFLCGNAAEDDDPVSWFRYLSLLKTIQGNSDNDLSFLACILAKRYLVEHHGDLSFDVSSKAQSAPGLDIDFRAADGTRVVGEVKTTTPHKPRDFGGQQWTTIRADLKKLHHADAMFKYLFVTDDRAHEILARRVDSDLKGIKLVRLHA